MVEKRSAERLWKSGLLLCLWVGGLGITVYIFAAYGWSGRHVRFDLWNTVLGNLYVPERPLATLGIGIHLFAGAVIALLGPLQLFPSLRAKYPHYHRLSGRIYLFAALAACLGGNAFIAMNGTVGGPVMSIGFSLYGWLLGICAVQAGRMAMQRRFEAHRRWALRLFVLGIGPLLYRIEYGLWALCMQGLVGHTVNWQGPLDYVMDFFFYIPNLVLVELYLRIDTQGTTRLARVGLPAAAGVAILAIVLGLILVAPNWWYPVVKKVLQQIP